MINYKPLWITMEEKGVSQYALIRKHGISAGQIGRMKRNGNVSTRTIERLCQILNCTVDGVMKFERN